MATKTKHNKTTKPSNKSTKPSNEKPVAVPVPLTASSGISDIIRAIVELDGTKYVVFTKRMSLGRVRRFTSMQDRLNSGETDVRHAFDEAASLLLDHIVHEDGSQMYNEDTVIGVPFDFAIGLCVQLIQLFNSRAERAVGKA